MTLRITSVLFLVLLALFIGCAGTQPSRFFTLTPIPEQQINAEFEDDNHELAIGIGPVNFPDYLNRKQIVTRSSHNEIKLSEFDRWAGELKENTIRILSENISDLLSTDLVFVHPWRGSTKLDYRIEIEVIRFDGDLGGKVVLISRWAVRGGQDKEVLYITKSRIEEPVETQGYPALVAAQSRALANLSYKISSTIERLSRAQAVSE